MTSADLLPIHQAMPPDGFEWVIAEDDDRDRIRRLTGKPLGSPWKPARVRLLRSDEGRAFAWADLPWMGSDVLVLRPSAMALAPHLVDYGELLPLESKDGEFWIFNATRIIDALDESRSDVEYYPSGRVMDIRRYAFRPEMLGAADIFKVPQVSATFYSAGFVSQFRGLGLVGVDFRPVWP